MKSLFLIGGTMGVGKTSVCQYLNVSLNNSVFLDDDWCWNADPFQVMAETKNMVIDNSATCSTTLFAVPPMKTLFFVGLCTDRT